MEQMILISMSLFSGENMAVWLNYNSFQTAGGVPQKAYPQQLPSIVITPPIQFLYTSILQRIFQSSY
jgi:hypothetical protein